MELKDFSFLLFGGKGGNGKTTSACATGLYLAGKNPCKKIMIASTDPAHSIGDSFDLIVGNSVTQVKDIKNLWALEISAADESENFKNKYDVVMKKIAERGTLFDKQDIESFFSLTIPGLDEVMAVIKIAGLLRKGDFDLIILDTAPTGHTIRFLGMPGQMEKFIHVMELMQSKHRFLVKQFTGRYRKDDADEFLETMYEDIRRLKRLLTNPNTTLFIPVVIPEYIPVMETEKLLKVLKKQKILAKYIIVNRVKMSDGICPYCSSEAEEQVKWLDEIRCRFAAYDISEVPSFPHEVRNIERLSDYGDILFGKKQYSALVQEKLTGKSESKEVFSLKRISFNYMNNGTCFYIFGGKGGVGKTSISAATSVHLAKNNPSKKLIIFSTDPAHSLSEIFEAHVGGEILQIKEQPNLYALEIDSDKLLNDFKENYRRNIDEIFRKFGRVDIKFDREVFEELVSVSPPGLDEIMALIKIIDFMDEDKFDIYVFDSASTGHLLNFLEMPQIIREWIKALFRLIIKYKNVIRLHDTAEDLLELSKGIRKVRNILTDASRCEFMAITIPEVMAINELERLLLGLNKLEIPVKRILFNMVRPQTDCDFCQLKRRGELEILQRVMQEKSSQYSVAHVPLFPHQINGVKRLSEMAEVLYE